MAEGGFIKVTRKHRKKGKNKIEKAAEQFSNVSTTELPNFNVTEVTNKVLKLRLVLSP